MSFDHTLFSRRLFLTRGVQLLSAAGTLPLFLDRSARCLAADHAANPQGAGRPDHRVLVVVQLAGGNDGLNTVVPITNDDYYRARRTLAVAKKSALRLTDDFGLHPSARGFKKLWDDGHMAVLHAVGYPNPNRSHFRSTDIWSSGDAEAIGRTGWLGRYFDACCNGEDPGPQAKGAAKKATDPAAAIALQGEPPMALVGKDYLPIVFRSPDDLAHAESSRDERLKSAFEKLNGVDPDEMMDARPGKIHIPRGAKGSVAPPPQQPQPDNASDFLQRSALNARVYADTIRKTVSAVQNKASYPATGLASQLKLTAQMIAAGLPTRVYYVQLGGFDTHSGQAPRHVRLLEELSGGLAAFVEDLKALGQLDRTTVMTFSEFGRRVAENGSAGTDHGEAAPMFVFGSSIKPGFHGTPPELSPAKLNRGDVRWSLDFRRVYATVLGQWLKADDAMVLGRRYEPVGLFAREKLQ
jgi:uncharacterized protein (DUF1501 family)